MTKGKLNLGRVNAGGGLGLLDNTRLIKTYTPDPAAVARLNAMMAQQRTAKKESDEMTKPTFSEAQIREIHERCVMGPSKPMTLAQMAKREVNGVADVSVSAMSYAFQRYELPLRKQRPKAKSKPKLKAKAKTTAVIKRPTATAVAPKPQVTAVPPPPPPSAEPIADGLDRLASMRLLVKDLEKAGARVTLSGRIEVVVEFGDE